MSTTFSSTATTKVIWLQHLVQELGIPLTVPKIYANNIGATYLCVDLVFHTRMKHSEIDYRHVQELLATEQLYVSHVPTIHQLADLLFIDHNYTSYTLLVWSITNNMHHLKTRSDTLTHLDIRIHSAAILFSFFPQYT